MPPHKYQYNTNVMLRDRIIMAVFAAIALKPVFSCVHPLGNRIEVVLYWHLSGLLNIIMWGWGQYENESFNFDRYRDRVRLVPAVRDGPGARGCASFRR